MRTSLVFYLLLTILLLVPSCSAALTLTQTTYTHDSVISQNQFRMVNLTIAGASPALYGYTIHGTVGPSVLGLPAISLLGEYFERDVAGNGTYRFNLNPRAYPFTSLGYPIVFSVSPYWKTNHTYVGTNTSATAVQVSFVTIEHPTKPNRILFRNHIPTSLDIDAGTHVAESGTSVNVTCIQYNMNLTCSAIPFTMYVYVTDASAPRNVLAYGTFPVEYETADTATFYNDYYYNNTEDLVATANYNFQYNHSYYIYYGVRITGGLTYANTLIDNDGTSSISAFSTEQLTSAGKLMDGPSYANDFTGICVYFECPYNANKVVSFAFTPGTLGNYFRDLGDNLGYPFLYLIVAFIFIALFCGIPFALSVKFDLNIPNFVYAVFISIGVVIDMGINLLDLWMGVFYFILLAFVVVTRFREAIMKSSTVSALSSRPRRERFREAGEETFPGTRGTERQEKRATRERHPRKERGDYYE